MKQQEFIINGHFLITPSLNAIRNLQTQKEMRLEARLMQLLCLLANTNGEVITREHIIKEIWNDYGGGDEGLSQAIFYLRKALEDTNKEIIETIPKKGYILHAVITDTKNNALEIPRPKSGKFMYVILAIAVGIAVFIILTNAKKDGQTEKDIMEIPYPELNEDSHTIITVDANGTKYKLIQIGDGRPDFYINDKQVGIEEQEKYLPLINEMSEALQKKNSSTKRL
ncbi:DNA-binding winged helix-turn-helix (wHTH) protein [Flavobacterium sp. 28YEA47A]|uniref:winged helix-turn-helix domain-containing protein n=1 Tax=Flavobacterium sp. 28YEA47A TaxID=3156276 RepID=UPI00351203A6